MAKREHRHFHGHTLRTCPIKKRIQHKFRQVWVPKGTRDIVTNVQGPKAIWMVKFK